MEDKEKIRALAHKYDGRKFRDLESGKILEGWQLVYAFMEDLTEEERGEYGTFARWLEEITGKNGTLEEVR